MNSATKKDSFNQKLQAHPKLTWGAVIFVILYTASLFIPLISPYTQYPLYVVKCLGRPLVINAGNYLTPDSPSYTIGILSSGYFCTEQEAQAAGHYKSPLNGK